MTGNLDTPHLKTVQCPTTNGQDKLIFPADKFPFTIHNLTEESQKSLGYYPDHLGTAVLFAASVAIGTTLRLKVKNEWREYATLFAALVGAPGTTKSHALSLALKPLEQAEKNNLKEYSSQKADYDNAETKGEKPILKQHLISDATTEGICLALTQNLRGVGLVRDELAGWLKDMNKYRAGSDEQFYLSIWSGKPVKVNRKTQDTISIFNPKVDVIGTIQPGILNDIANGSKSKNGFIDRILFAYPDKFEATEWSENELSRELMNEYGNIIQKLLDLEYVRDESGEFQPGEVIFSTGAKKVFTQWYNKNANLKFDATFSEQLRDSYAKLDVYVCRIALIMQMLFWASGEDDQYRDISDKSIHAAIDLTEYYRTTFKKVIEQVNKVETPAELKVVLKMRANNTSYRDIEAATGVPKSTAEYWVKKFGRLDVGHLTG